MREYIFFIFLLALVICPYPGSNEDAFEPIRQERRKKLSKEIKECLLKEELSADFKAILGEKPDEDIITISFRNRSAMDKRDKEILKKCRKEVHLKYMETFKNKRYYHVLNKTYHKPDPNENHEPIE